MKLKKVHEDKRGSIHSVTGIELKEHDEAVLIFTKKGYARGGCINDINDEHHVLIEGKVIFYIPNKIDKILNKGDDFYVYRGFPHYMIALEDSLILEWGTIEEERCKKDKSTLDIVNKINEEN